MRSGKLTQLITFERRSKLQDDFHHGDEKWSAVASCWAAVQPKRGNEPIVADQVNEQGTHKVTVRHSRLVEDISTAWRITWGGRVLQILSVANIDARNRWLELECREYPSG